MYETCFYLHQLFLDEILKSNITIKNIGIKYNIRNEAKLREVGLDTTFKKLYRKYYLRNILDEKLTFEYLYNEYIIKNKTTYQIAHENYTYQSNISKYLKKYNIKKERKKIGDIYKSKIKKGKEYYYQVQTENGSKPLHTAKMEKYLKRDLRKGEGVHHIDGNKLNNKISNLALYENNELHGKIHNSLRKISYKLIRIGIIEFDKEKRIYFIPENIELYLNKKEKKII